MAAKRHVVVDGSNLATEGRSTPSLAQLDEAVKAYSAEDPTAEIVVVVDASFEHRIDPSERQQLEEAELHGELVSPPAGAIGRGDAFVLRIAERTGATVLSNDSFQEFHAEHPWLFDEGRLVGGKPVPGVGWIFTPRIPVRGPKSRQVTGKAKGRAAAETLAAPEKAAELAKAARKAAKSLATARNGDGSAAKIGDVWVRGERRGGKTKDGKAAADKARAPKTKAGAKPAGGAQATKSRTDKGGANAAAPPRARAAQHAVAAAPVERAAKKAVKAAKASKKRAPAAEKAVPAKRAVAAAPVERAAKRVTKKTATKAEKTVKKTPTAAKTASAKKSVPRSTAAKKSAGGAKKAASRAAGTRKATKTAGTATPPAVRGSRLRKAITEATAEALQPPDPADLDDADAAHGKRKHPKRRRRAVPLPAVNEPLAFITFVAACPIGSSVEGTVTSFTSHGAMIDVILPDGEAVHCYAPLAGLGDPPPTKARDVLTRGETRDFVLVALDASRRVADLALPAGRRSGASHRVRRR
jgi:hypothetical protein